MKMKKLALWLGISIIVTSFVVISPISARSQNQNASLTVSSGNIVILQTPDNFLFDPVFIDNSSTYEIHKTLAPTVAGNRLIVDDSDSTGRDFNVTMAISNFVSDTSVIPFSNISFVTLASDAGGIDSYSPGADLTDLNTPNTCTAWATNLEYGCASSLNNNYMSESLQSFAVDPAQDVNATNTIINVDSYDSDPDPNNVVWAVRYAVDDIIEFSDGEKALVTSTTPGPSGSAYIIVIRGILNTTPAIHTAGSGIDSHGNTSISEVIMDAPEPADPRIGAYSIGFGFKGLIEPTFPPGTYTGTITYDLNIT